MKRQTIFMKRVQELLWNIAEGSKAVLRVDGWPGEDSLVFAMGHITRLAIFPKRVQELACAG